MTATYVYSTTLTVITCGNCRIPYAIPDDLYRARLQDGRNFYCPNGHVIHYSETENARLTRQLRSAQDTAARVRAEKDQIEASRRAYKGQATKLRNRAVSGDCPICGQSVYQLGRHMSRAHPDETQHTMTEAEALSGS